MATETDGDEDAHPPAAPNPHREGRREPAFIDARAEAAGDEASGEAEPREVEPAAAGEPPEPPAKAPRAPPTMPPNRILPKVALGLAVVALVIAFAVGGHVFVTTDGAIVDLRAATAALQSGVAALDQKNAAAPDDAGALAALDQRVAALEAAVKAASANLAALQSDTQKAVSLAEAPQAPAAEPGPQVDLGPLEQRVADLEARLKPLAAAIAASKADVNASQEIVRKAVTSSDAAALVVVAQSLVGALDRGAPFASEVAALQTLGADPQRIAVLQPFAAKGVPNAAALADSFAPLAAPILTGLQEKQPQGLLDRLERDASSLVRVRPVGAAAPKGSDAAAVVARIEGALAERDVAGAVAAWEQLPAPAKNVTGDWASAAKARVAADAAAHALLADAIDRLGRSKS